jgi:hypothetical protein
LWCCLNLGMKPLSVHFTYLKSIFLELFSTILKALPQEQCSAHCRGQFPRHL